jgi:hypothetical protein
MKAIITVCFMILVLSSVRAEMCMVSLVDGQGETQNRFVKMGGFSCEDAAEACEDFLEWEVKFKKGMSCVDQYGINHSDNTFWDAEIELGQNTI